MYNIDIYVTKIFIFFNIIKQIIINFVHYIIILVNIYNCTINQIYIYILSWHILKTSYFQKN